MSANGIAEAAANLGKAATVGPTFAEAMERIRTCAEVNAAGIRRLDAALTALGHLGDRGKRDDHKRLTEAILRGDSLFNVTMSDGACRIVCRPQSRRWTA